MAKTPVPLTSLSEEQRAQALARFEIVRPALEDGIPQARNSWRVSAEEQNLVPHPYLNVRQRKGTR